MKCHSWKADLFCLLLILLYQPMLQVHHTYSTGRITYGITFSTETLYWDLANTNTPISCSQKWVELTGIIIWNRNCKFSLAKQVAIIIDLSLDLWLLLPTYGLLITIMRDICPTHQGNIPSLWFNSFLCRIGKQVPVDDRYDIALVFTVPNNPWLTERLRVVALSQYSHHIQLGEGCNF